MSNEKNTLPALRQENVLMIMESAPQVYDKNTLSSQKCSEAGERLLDDIRRKGMTDELDLMCSAYIEKTKKTLKVMNERRSPFTKIFDQVRSEFTSMENAIDPSKKDSIPWQVQQARNAYAAKKRAEEEARRQEELRRQQHESDLAGYRQSAENDFRQQFDDLVTKDIDFLSALSRGLTMDNYTATLKKVMAVDINLSPAWVSSLQCHVHKPFGITDAEAVKIREEVMQRILPDLKTQYKAEIGEYKDTILETLPNKYAELERISKADAELQARLKAELEAKQAAELRSLDEERKKKEQEAHAAKQMQQQATEMGNLFEQARIATPAGYQPKASVRLKATPLNAQGVLDILTMWWIKEGQFTPVDELQKMFKKQMTFVDRLANDKEAKELINTPNVRYDEEVKAK